MALAAAAPARPPDASAAKKPTLKQKKQRCLKKAAKKRSKRARRSAARRCRRRYARKPVARTPPRALTTPAASAPGPSTPAAPLARYVSVTAREFTLTLSRPLVGAGEVTIELRNYGENPHDLMVERSDTEVGRWGELGPGAVGKKKLALSSGSYQLFCSIEGHEVSGMKATLKVGG